MEKANKAAQHSIGEFVSYKSNGICEITDIITRDFGGLGDKTYYEMKLVFDKKTVIYVPTDSAALEAGMRHVLSADEINAIISECEKSDSLWIEPAKERSSRFSEILTGDDREKILRIIKELSARRDSLETDGRKMYASDLKILSSAEKQITEEFAFGLGIDRDEVVPYILRRIKNTADLSE